MTDSNLHTLDISRRGFLRSAGLIAGAGALIAAVPAAAGSKFSQAMAKYQAGPKGAQRCANCTQYASAGACKVVEGEVSPNGWCFLYASKG